MVCNGKVIIESKLYEAINNLIKRRQDPNSEEYRDLLEYTFYNDDTNGGKDVPFKSVHYSDQNLINIVSIFHNLLLYPDNVFISPI
jgi:hypothetical protein